MREIKVKDASIKTYLNGIVAIDVEIRNNKDSRGIAVYCGGKRCFDADYENDKFVIHKIDLDDLSKAEKDFFEVEK